MTLKMARETYADMEAIGSVISNFVLLVHYI
jgi:hypothetical protein